VKAAGPSRPRDRARLRSRANILAAARELVLADGVDQLSLRGVAARAGFSPAGLYEYFDGKDALVAALAADVAAKLDARLVAVPATLPPPRRLIRLGLAYLAFARDCPEDYLLLFARLSASRSGPDQPASGAYGRVLAAAQAGLDDGSLRATRGDDAEELAYGLWALVHGMAMLQLTHLKGYPADFEAADRRIVERLIASFSI
jgi:AcrR family transcriptional regulator